MGVLAMNLLAIGVIVGVIIFAIFDPRDPKP